MIVKVITTNVQSAEFTEDYTYTWQTNNPADTRTEPQQIDYAQSTARQLALDQAQKWIDSHPSPPPGLFWKFAHKEITGTTTEPVKGLVWDSQHKSETLSVEVKATASATVGWERIEVIPPKIEVPV